MTVYVDKIRDRWYGACYGVSTECSDPVLYPSARTATEAVEMFEKDKRCSVNIAYESIDGSYEVIRG